MERNRDELLKELEEQELLLKYKEGLPHLYGYKLYKWSYDYMHEYKSKIWLICAANQISKSSTQIRKCITMATDLDFAYKFFPRRFREDPNWKPTFWYLYPDADTTMSEFYEKWEKEWLPRGEFKNDPKYGWEVEIKNKVLKAVHFNTGVSVYFKTYTQDVSHLQAGTAAVIFTDEELPENLFPELIARTFATDGYFSMVFTATKGQQFWRDAIDPIKPEDETFRDAFKRRISLYDCQYHMDGTKSAWSLSRIRSKEALCKNSAEINRRIHGRFVKDEGLKYSAFSRDRNLVKFPVGKNGLPYKGVIPKYNVYTGIDHGSGGEKNHPSAFVAIQCNEEFTDIRCFYVSRLDKISTTQADTFKHYIDFRDKYKLKPLQEAYDWSAKDFGTMAENSSLGVFVKANKSHEVGEGLLNSLFKLGILKLVHDEEDDEDEMLKLVSELESFPEKPSKNKVHDDIIDALRYAVATIPDVDWDKIILSKSDNSIDLEPAQIVILDRNSERELRPDDFRLNTLEDIRDDYESEIDEWNSMY